MTKQQQFSVISIIASSFAVWLFIVTQVQPNRNDLFTLVIFFISLIIWAGSIIAIFLFNMRLKQSNREIIYAHIKPSVRQGFLISTAIALLLFLQLIRVISVWDALLVLSVFLLFEYAMRDVPALKKKQP
jgi:hypothetical protein